MPARVVRESTGADTVLVFLDCEGIGSPEREKTEDTLHCLLVCALSRLTMFKARFAFGKYASSCSTAFSAMCTSSGWLSQTRFCQVPIDLRFNRTWSAENAATCCRLPLSRACTRPSAEWDYCHNRCAIFDSVS